MKALKIAILYTAITIFLSGCGDKCPYDVKSLQKHIEGLEAQIADQAESLIAQKSRDVAMLLHCNKFHDLGILAIAFCDYAAAEAGVEAYAAGYRTSPVFEVAYFLRSALAIALALFILAAPLLAVYRHTSKVSAEKAQVRVIKADLDRMQGQVAEAKSTEQEIGDRVEQVKKELETLNYSVTQAKKS
ncbi:hypothetical protein P8S54_11075 (plasmid) [Thiomicrospira sp. R3]|uniref:hypothetical protein n=1 Tax=Thiomicrospira sp. R3 TaxID=3035472 RepID=UPI00259BECD1|nr:hypothetical protein [Thiomicrospira sp. R3]WFE69830.1 hypothetical protein P8S54_11075 [Thiomicrospira sp. R3]